MPSITVRTRPVQGRVIIFRVMGRYGVMKDGMAPVSAWRQYPWSYVVALQPIIVKGVLWVPEVNEQRGMAEQDMTLTFRYLRVGRVN